MTDEPPYHAPVEVVSAVTITPQCPACRADLEPEELEEDEGGAWVATEGGFRACEGCRMLLELPRLDLRNIGRPIVLDRVCDTVICQDAEGGDRQGSGVTEHGR